MSTEVLKRFRKAKALYGMPTSLQCSSDVCVSPELAMLSAKREIVEEAGSQLSLGGPLQRRHVSASQTNNDILPQHTTPTVSAHKRSVSVITPATDQRPSQRACRELFSPNSAQAAPAVFSQQPVDIHYPGQSSRSPLALTSTDHAQSQATPIQLAQPPSAATPVPTVPVADLWSLLLANSGQVLHQRLSNSNLLSPPTATGQELLELEVQLQALLGIRQDEEGSDNVCWVDHGFLHYAQGVMYFHGMYGDAECGQVT